MLGEQVYVGNATEGEQKININISNFTEGVYVCILTDAYGKKQATKFNVIKK
jgi:peptide methionine sulfoxide reductase MsrB